MNIQNNGTKHRDTHYNGNLHNVLNCDTYHIGLNYNTQHNDSAFGINTKYHNAECRIFLSLCKTSICSVSMLNVVAPN